MAFSQPGSWLRAVGISGRFLLATAVLAPSPAVALWEDRLEIFAVQNVTRDSNVFRISENTNSEIELGTGSLGDTVSTTTVGFALDIPYSLQRLRLGYSAYAARYRRFDELDHNGHAASASWLWSVTPHVTGDVGYDQRRTLANFATVLGTQPDFVTTRLAYANAAWMMTPSWRLHGAFNAAESEHSEVRELSDLRFTSVEAGLSYVTASENRLGVAARSERGRSPEETTFLGVPFDNEYRQESLGVQGRWVLTGLSRLDGRADYTRRRYENFSERDYKGPTWRLTYTYTPTGKITVSTTAMRDVAPIEDMTSSFVLVTGLSIRPDWAVTGKITVRGNLSYAKWEYRGATLLGEEFEHRVRTGGLSVLYRPTRRIAITGGVSREKRTSTLLTGDYEVNLTTLEARIGF
jgi:exopolysaccharide biosynthesis operon protein EpsL